MKKPKVPPEEVIAIILEEKHEILTQNGSIAVPSNPIWDSLSDKLQRQISAKALYTIVKCNRYQVWDKLNIEFQSSVSSVVYSQLQLEGTNRCDEEFPEEDTDFSEVEKHQLSMKYDIVLEEDIWSHLQPTLLHCQRKDKDRPLCHSRTREILSPYRWTHVISSCIWEKSKTPCTWIFKRANVNRDHFYYVYGEGFCKQCGAKIVFKIFDESSSKHVLRLKIFDFDKNVEHKSSIKRPVSGFLRDKIAKGLRSKAPIALRRDMADRLMGDEDFEPSHLPKLHILHQVNHEEELKKMYDSEPILSLWKAKFTPSYYGSLHEICLDPFHAHYFSPLQLSIYNEYCQKETSTLAIDSTGSICRPPHPKCPSSTNFKKKHVFLYQAVAQTIQGPSFPVLQMISQRHDIPAIERWLTDLQRKGAKKPDVVVTDFSLALIGAVTRAFTNCSSTNDYVNKCSKVLAGDAALLPETFIRVDVAHFMKIVCDLECFKGRDKRVKHFYSRCFGLLVNITSFLEAKDIIREMLFVALSEYEGLIDNEIVRAEMAKEKLRKAISTGQLSFVDMIENIENNLGDVPFIQEEATINANDICSSWIDQIISEVKKDVSIQENGNRDNLHFLPDIVPHIRRLCSKISLWSGLMTEAFGLGKDRASSASVESYFRDLKCFTLKYHHLPMRVDLFIFNHLSSIQGHIKLARANALDKKFMFESSMCDGNGFDDPDDPSVLENAVEVNAIEQHCDSMLKDGLIKNYCVACNNGHLPQGAHVCIQCNVAVHILEGCSVIVPGEEEGHGEQRRCISCNNSRKVAQEPETSVSAPIRSSLPHVHDKYEENWRGLNQPSDENLPLKKRGRFSYLYPSSDWLTLDLSSKKRPGPLDIGILQNGSMCSPVKLEGHNSTFDNTCAFDAIVSSLACLYCDKEDFRRKVDEISSQDILCELIQTLSTKGSVKNTYYLRARLLNQYFKTHKLVSGMEHIACDAIAGTVARKILHNFPSVKCRRECSSEFCSHKNTFEQFVVTPLDAICLQRNNISSLQEAIQRALNLSHAKCYRALDDPKNVPNAFKLYDRDIAKQEVCNGDCTFTNIASKTMFIVEYYSVPKEGTISTTDYEEIISLQLSEIPQQIEVQGEMYHLFSIIDFIAPKSEISLGHYIAHCKRLDGSWVCYDDLKKKSFISKRKVVPHLLIYFC